MIHLHYVSPTSLATFLRARDYGGNLVLCSNCGEKIEDSTNFCSKCGALQKRVSCPITASGIVYLFKDRFVLKLIFLIIYILN